MNQEQRAQIEERLAAATPGPWRARRRDAGDSGFVEAKKVDPNMPYNIEVLGDDETGYPTKAADVDFIAHAPEDVRLLLDALREAEVRIQHLANDPIQITNGGDKAKVAALEGQVRRLEKALGAIARAHDPEGGCLRTCACSHNENDDCDCGYQEAVDDTPGYARAALAAEPASPAIIGLRQAIGHLVDWGDSYRAQGATKLLADLATILWRYDSGKPLLTAEPAPGPRRS